MTASDLPKLPAPAVRALNTIGVTRLNDVSAYTESELLALHGFGPLALRRLQQALIEAGLSLRQ